MAAPERLPDGVRTVLEDAATRLLVSAATAWEMAIKHHAGKWPEAEPLIQRHADFVARLGAASLDITAEHAIRAGGLGWGHRDPFDRMLAAQALNHPARLVTGDTAFTQLPGLDVFW